MKQKQLIKGKKKDVIMGPGWIWKKKNPDSIKEDNEDDEQINSPDSKNGQKRSWKLRYSWVTDA